VPSLSACQIGVRRQGKPLSAHLHWEANRERPAPADGDPDAWLGAAFGALEDAIFSPREGDYAASRAWPPRRTVQRLRSGRPL
jgi:hypothetical protein